MKFSKMILCRFLGRVPRVAFMLSFCGLIPSVLAVNPSWWTDQQYGFWNGSDTDYFAPLNVGQLKYVANQAKAYLDSELGGINWNDAYSPNSNPLPFSNTGDNFAPVNVGQLKAVAYGFYRVLAEVDYPVRASLMYQGVSSADISVVDGMNVPWNGIGLNPENYAPANVGQLKVVFSFSVNPDGSSAYDLSGIGDVYGFVDTDADNDLFDAWVKLLAGEVGSGFASETTAQGWSDNEELDQSVQTTGVSGGVVIVLPTSGVYLVGPSDFAPHKL